MVNFFVNPRIMIISPNIELNNGDSYAYEDFENFLNNEKYLIKKIVEKILRCKPNVIFVEKSINRIANDILTHMGVTMIHKIKPALLKRIARITRAKIINNPNKLDKINSCNKIMGKCEKLYTKKFEKFFKFILILIEKITFYLFLLKWRFN